jgi:hypothetical protein
MKKVGIVACSDAQKEEYRERNEELVRFLSQLTMSRFLVPAFMRQRAFSPARRKREPSS